MATTEDTLRIEASDDPAESSAGGPTAAEHRQLPATRLIPPPPRTRRGRRLVRMATRGVAPLDRRNRAIFMLVGLVVAAAGVAALLLHEGVVHTTAPDVLYARWVGDARGNVDLAAAIATAICLVVFLLAAWWALAQLRPVSDGERVGTIRLTKGPRGRTTLAAATLAKAASTDLAGRPGIASGRLRVRAASPHPRIQVMVEVALDADLDTVLVEVEEAVDHLVGALGEERASADVELRLRFARAGRSG